MNDSKWRERRTEVEQIPEVKLKQFVGHTPVQVLAGIVVGVLTALGMYWILY